MQTLKKGEMRVFINLELNQKFGRGYQIRVIHGPVNQVYDKEPYNLNEAAQRAKVTLEIFQKELGEIFDPDEVIGITGEALEVNRRYDIASAQFFKDVKSGAFNYCQPAPIPDVMPGDGEEMLLSARGVLLFSYLTWNEERTEPAKKFMMRYCQLLASRGYGKGATQIFDDMDKMDKDSGCEWIRKTYEKYTHNDEEVIALFQ